MEDASDQPRLIYPIEKPESGVTLRTRALPRLGASGDYQGKCVKASLGGRLIPYTVWPFGVFLETKS